jgi:hypothetical protein
MPGILSEGSGHRTAPHLVRRGSGGQGWRPPAKPTMGKKLRRCSPKTTRNAGPLVRQSDLPRSSGRPPPKEHEDLRRLPQETQPMPRTECAAAGVEHRAGNGDLGEPSCGATKD